MVTKELLKEFLTNINIDVGLNSKDLIRKFGGFFSPKDLMALEVRNSGITEILNSIKDTLELTPEDYSVFMSFTAMFIDFLYYKNIVNEFIDSTIEKRKILVYFLNSSVSNTDEMIDGKTKSILECKEKDILLLLGSLYVFSIYAGDIEFLLGTFITNQNFTTNIKGALNDK